MYNITDFDTVALDEASCSLVNIDQTFMPCEVAFLSLSDPAAIHDAIRNKLLRF